MTDILFCRIGPLDQWQALWGGVIIAAIIFVAGALLFPTALLLRDRIGLGYLAAGCALFQAGHFAEHGDQILGLGVTGGGLTLTWWAREIVYGYAWLTRTNPEIGLECMHFAGDLIYLAGVIAWRRLHPTRLATSALFVQGAHQIEHTYLVSSALLGGTPIGLTVIGPIGLRVVMHFTLNFGGTALWALSAWDLRRGR